MEHLKKYNKFIFSLMIFIFFFLDLKGMNLKCPDSYHNNKKVKLDSILKEKNFLIDKTILVSKYKEDFIFEKKINRKFFSISQAIQKANEGDLIIIKEGKYFESLTKELFDGKKDLRIISYPGHNVELWNVEKKLLTSLDKFNLKDIKHIYNSDFDKLQVSTFPYVDLSTNYPNVSFMKKLLLEKVNEKEFKIIIDEKIDIDLVGADFLGYINKSWTAINGKVIQQFKTSEDKTILIVEAFNNRFKLNGFQGKGYGYFLNKKEFITHKNQFAIQENRLYVFNPDKETIYLSTKRNGIEIMNSDNLIISGIKIFGGSILIENSKNIILDNLQLVDPIPFFRFKKFYAYSDKLWEGKGLTINGNNNIIQNCNIKSSWGDGISVFGNNNIIINNSIINSNRIGVAAAAISVDGVSNDVIGNIINGTGRDGINIKFAKKGKISCNSISNMGGLTKDLGGIYTIGTDSEGLEISYNEIFNNKDRFGPGIYLDNKSSNYIVHHNLLYASFEGIRINPPAIGHIFHHNTIITNRSSMSRARVEKGKLQKKDILTFRNLSFHNVRGNILKENLIINRDNFDFNYFIPKNLINEYKDYYGAIDYRLKKDNMND